MTTTPNHPRSCLRVRPIAANDIDALLQLATEAGIGMTTLPADRAALTRRIEWSIASFVKKIKQPEYENYFFVMEDLTNHAVVGCSAIESKTGAQQPFYSFKLIHRHLWSPMLSKRTHRNFLLLTNDKENVSEICTLFLTPSYRHSRNGEFLARIRFLFMADFPERFEKNVIAELRGVVDEKGHSPFWEGLGRFFFDMDFREADHRVALGQKDFITDLLPNTIIPVALLNKAAQTVIGEVQQSTKPARALLEREGFEYRDYVDIFDAGPTLEATIKQLRTVRDSRVGTITKVIDATTEAGIKTHLISNRRLLFRACVGGLSSNEQSEVVLTKEVADSLEVAVGDSIRFIPFND